MFMQGAFELAADVQQFGQLWDCDDTSTFTQEESCGLMLLDVSSPYCTARQSTTSEDGIDKCVVVRVRGRSLTGEGSFVAGVHGTQGGNPVYIEALAEGLPLMLSTLEGSCRISQPMIVKGPYIGTNQGDASGQMWFDYVEVHLTECEAVTSDCQLLPDSSG